VSRRSAQRVAQAPGESGDTQEQIFAATERLLEQVSVHELSVAQIIEGAGVSRATFYFYFSSKYAVIVGLLGHVMDEIYDVARPFLERPDDEPPDEALRRGITAAAQLWSTHRLAMRAVSEHWHAVPELRSLWLEVVERFTDAFAAEIDRQRKAGLAPAGPDTRPLVASLLWATERCFYVAGLGVDDALPSEEVAAQALYELWYGAIYAGLPAATPKKTPARSRRA
jgi:AcrR family transcriptional regulator